MVNAAQISDLKARLQAEAERLGFVAFGVTSAVEDPVRSGRLEQWLDAGNHGSMTWMEERKGQRASPQGLWPEAKSVIALGLSYAPASDPLALEAHPERARISVYAQGREYHDTLKKRL